MVGAGLGQDSIEKGKMASYFGAVLVVVFMVVTYGLFGVFASIAVGVNVGMIFGVLSLLNATLTLPEIIGIVLTVGNEPVAGELSTGLDFLTGRAIKRC